MTMASHFARGTVAVLWLACACNDDAAPGRTFYDENIQPIFTASCARNVAGCHAADPDDEFAFAAGNLDLTSFENVDKRRDLLRTFGAYPAPVMLIKAVSSTCDLRIPYRDERLCIEDPHGGGAVFQVGSPAFLTLQQWMANGATENGLPPPAPPETGEGSCTSVIPPDFDPAPIVADPAFGQFERDVQPVLAGCESGTCHGAPQADFFISCGSTQEQVAFNFAQARAFVDDPVDNSELLQRPLAVSGGGFGHTGGDHFQSSNDEGYRAIAAWAEAVGPIEFGEGDPGKEFFADHIQPLLLSRGCSFEACHSPQSFNDLKLRPGSQGFFSAIALEKNYELLKEDFMAMEFADARNSRAVAKNIFGRDGGISHRGGALLQNPGSGASVPSSCDPVFDAATASAFCTFQEWVRIEREALLAADQVTPMGSGDVVRMVYVDRDADHVASPLEFDTYQPGSDLMAADLTLGADGAIAGAGAPVSILGTCPGDRASRDVSGPEVNIDGETVVFSMRLSAGEPRELYTVSVQGVGCQKVTPAGFGASADDGSLLHNFDPVWSPDGEYIVFASTKAGGVSRRIFEPQSDIWRMRADGSEVEQVTVLTNSEMSPSFMREGRIIMSTEKVSADFYQVSGRRINWDLTDYHPLLAQRSQSVFCDPDDLTLTCPSVDYEQATEIREAADGNFLLVLSDRGARAGAGTLAVFNRSIGPFEAGRSDPGYLQSMRLVDRFSTGRAGSATEGAYRSPASLPGGGILVSYAAVTGDLATINSIDFDIVATRVCTPPAPGATCDAELQPVIGGAGQQVEATLALKRPPHAGYENRRQLVFGGGVDIEATKGEDQALLHMIDAPVVFTLLVANLRRGRPVEAFRGAAEVAVYIERGAPTGTSSGNGQDHYEDRMELASVPLQSDGSVKVLLPAHTPLVFELRDENGNALVTMREAHQFGPGEVISMGVVANLFDAVCAGCHGSISGRELDVRVTPDALTGASQSLSLEGPPINE